MQCEGSKSCYHRPVKGLFAIGIYKGDVYIFEDRDLLEKCNFVPEKPFLSGSHAYKLFKPSSIYGGVNKFYQDIVLIEQNYLDNGAAHQCQLQVWIAFKKLIPNLTSLTLTIEQWHFFKALIDNFNNLYINHFGKYYVTQYIVHHSLSIEMLSS